MKKLIIIANKERRKKRERKKIAESGRGRRLSVFRSNKYIIGQIIDLPTGKTLLTAGDKTLMREKGKGETKVSRAFKAGKFLAQKAIQLGIKKVVFDKGGYLYHGRIKAFADGAREGGLKF